MNTIFLDSKHLNRQTTHITLSLQLARKEKQPAVLPEWGLCAVPCLSC